MISGIQKAGEARRLPMAVPVVDKESDGVRLE